MEPRTRRLAFVAMSPEAIEALLDREREVAEDLLRASLPDGWPDEHDARFLRLRLDQLRSEPESARWLLHALVLPSESLVVGHAGFHGPPGVNGPGKAGAVELGYAIFPRFRGRGYATEAAAALIEWAREEGVRHVIASVSPENAPSLAVVRKLGFVQTGEQWDDEDGLELVFERSLSIE
ncbi:MAG: GNAT family N-acetyltransferase [Actinobacteria bacterium]|nr:GNAT family N-acetyltransferase [Actinomycetota bacterium]